MQIFRRILAWLIGLPAALAVIALAVANRTTVRFSLDPISQSEPFFAVDLPLFVVMLAAAFLGLLIGFLVMWLSQGKWRKLARTSRDEAHRWREEARRSRATVTAPPEAEPLGPERMLRKRNDAA